MVDRHAPAASELEQRHIADLHALAADRGIPRFRTLRREDLIRALLGEAEGPAGAPAAGAAAVHSAPEGPPEAELGAPEPAETVRGVLDVVPDGFGFLRVAGFSPSPDDVYVGRRLVRELGLRRGDEIVGNTRPQRRSERYASLASVEEVNGDDLHAATERPQLEELPAAPPVQPVPLVHHPEALGARMIDLLAPPRKGDRIVVSADPSSGVTTLLLELSTAAARAGAVRSIFAQVDARPEEATEWHDALGEDVWTTGAERSPDAHVRVASLALERAKRLAERGDDVLLVLDSLSRLARAHRLARHRERSNGTDDLDLDSPRAAPDESAVRAAARFFGTGRATQAGGSLTIVTAVRRGSESPLEQLLAEEVADSATAGLVLDGALAREGLRPAIDPTRAWRRDGIGLAEREGAPARLRGALAPMPPREGCALLLERLRTMRSNDEVLASLERGL